MLAGPQQVKMKAFQICTSWPLGTQLPLENTLVKILNSLLLGTSLSAGGTASYENSYLIFLKKYLGSGAELPESPPCSYVDQDQRKQHFNRQVVSTWACAGWRACRGPDIRNHRSGLSPRLLLKDWRASQRRPGIPGFKEPKFPLKKKKKVQGIVAKYTEWKKLSCLLEVSIK